MDLSVCLATYNGERFIEEQLRSILAQLGPEDEVIVVDDQSTDHTTDAIKAVNDQRIRLYSNERNIRDVQTFARAMELATHRYVFLSDQDDVWVPGRVAAMQAALAAGLSVVSSNFRWIDEKGKSIEVPFDGVHERSSNHHLRNITDIFIGKTNYFGCAMAYRQELRPVLLPIPRFVESHDLWLALVGNILRSNRHLDAITLLKRRHGSNATSTVSRRSLYYKLRGRVIFALSIVVILYRRMRFGFRRPAAEAYS